MAVFPAIPPVAARCFALSTSNGAKYGRGWLTSSDSTGEDVEQERARIEDHALSAVGDRGNMSFARSSAMDSATRASAGSRTAGTAC